VLPFLLRRYLKDIRLVHTVSLVSRGLYKAISNDPDLWEALWAAYHTVILPSFDSNTPAGLTLVLLREKDVLSQLEAAEAAPDDGCAWRQVYRRYRWLRLDLNQEVKDVTRYFGQFKKLVNGWGNVTEIEACLKFKLKGGVALLPSLAPWNACLLTDFLVWKPLNEATLHRDMFLFDSSENTDNYEPYRAMAALPQPTLEALMRRHLGVDRPRGQPLTQQDLARLLNSRDPAQTFVAFKIAVQQSLAPLDEILHVFEFRRPYFKKGLLNWSLLVVTKGEGLLLNIATTI